MNLDSIHRGIKKRKSGQRVGRGTGSGVGKTSGRGHNGQKSRAGWSSHHTFQGGSMPMVRRIPKRGFNNRWALQVAVVNVGDLEEAFAAGDEVTAESLKAKGMASYRYDVLKVLGNGELTKKLKITAHRFSKSACEKIEKAGGEMVVLPGKKPVPKNKMGTRKRLAAKS